MLVGGTDLAALRVGAVVTAPPAPCPAAARQIANTRDNSSLNRDKERCVVLVDMCGGSTERAERRDLRRVS
jgi:type IV pilus biogenesis protein CpaD/CtpE